MSAGLLLFVGCESGRSDPPHEIAQERYQVDSSQPLFATDGQEVGGFGRVEWAGRLPDGTVVVADRQTQELHFYPVQGDPFTAASRGGGPGEFGLLSGALVLPPDSVLVLDAEGSVLVYGPDGEFARSVPDLPYPGESQDVVGLSGDSALVLKVRHLDIEPGFNVDSATFVTVSLRTGAVLGEFTRPNQYSYLYSSPGERTVWLEVPFIGEASAGTLDGSILWGSGSAPVLERVNLMGIPRDTIQLPLADRPLRASEVSRVRSEQTEDAAPARRRAWTALFQDVPLPDYHPAYAGLLVAADGGIWVKLASVDKVEWRAFDPRGRPQRAVFAADNLEVLEFLDDTVLGVETLEDDRHRVVILPLVPLRQPVSD